MTLYFANFTDVSLLLLRLMLGLVFLDSGRKDLMHPDDRAKGLGLPRAFVLFLACAELAGGLGVLAGLLVQFASIGLILVMLGAVQKKIFVWKTGFWGKNGLGWNYECILISMLLVTLCTGGGRYTLMHALNVQQMGLPAMAATASEPVAGTLPPGYRDWKLISLAVLGPPYSDVRAKLGNDLAIAAYRKGAIPFPDGAIIARLAWKQVPSQQNNSAFRQNAAIVGLNEVTVEKLLSNSFVAGPATNVQIMVKDAKKYAATGGWGFAQFTNGKPDKIVRTNCMACHASAADHDFVFTRYSP